MTGSEAKDDLIGRTVTDVVLGVREHSEDLFDSVALYLDDGLVIVFRSVPESECK